MMNNNELFPARLLSLDLLLLAARALAHWEMTGLDGEISLIIQK